MQKKKKIHSCNYYLTWIWHSALSHQLSQQNTEGPHVRFDGESAIQSRLWCSPLNGKLGSWKNNGTVYTISKLLQCSQCCN